MRSALKYKSLGLVAQSGEHSTVTAEAAGSKPVKSANFLSCSIVALHPTDNRKKVERNHPGQPVLPPVGLAVMTAPFHGVNRDSNSLRETIFTELSRSIGLCMHPD